MLKALKSRSKAPASSLAKRLRNSTAAKESMPKFHQGLLVFTPFHHALPCFTLTFELLKEPLLVDLGRRDPHEDSSRLSRLKTSLKTSPNHLLDFPFKIFSSISIRCPSFFSSIFNDFHSFSVVQGLRIFGGPAEQRGPVRHQAACRLGPLGKRIL